MAISKKTAKRAVVMILGWAQRHGVHEQAVDELLEKLQDLPEANKSFTDSMSELLYLTRLPPTER